MTQTLLEELKAVANKRIDPLLKKRERLQKELDDLNKEIATAQRAMDVLDGKAPAKTKEKPQKRSRKNSKPSASPEKVLEVLKAELKRGSGKMSKSELVAAAKEKLKGSFGLTGLKQRAEKLIAEQECFAVKGSAVSLSAKAPRR